MSASEREIGTPLSRAREIRKQAQIIKDSVTSSEAQADAAAIESVADGLIEELEGQHVE